MGTGTVVAVVLAVLALFVIVLSYNSLVGRRNQADNAFAGIEASLKQRYDLIPNLVAAVRQYMQHEAGLLTRITELRVQAAASSADRTLAINQELGGALRNIMVAVENYPALRATEDFQNLERALNEVEERLSAARRAFNAAVTDYNNAVAMFPTNIVAAVLSFRARPLFEAEPAARVAPDVRTLFNS